MLRSKEIQEQMRKKVIEIYQSGKGYKAISKPLGLQQTTVRAIIHKWRKHGTVVNLPRGLIYKACVRSNLILECAYA